MMGWKAYLSQGQFYILKKVARHAFEAVGLKGDEDGITLAEFFWIFGIALHDREDTWMLAPRESYSAKEYNKLEKLIGDLAPWIDEELSYAEWEGSEPGDYWKWAFYNEELHTAHGHVTYDEPREEEMEEKKTDTNVNEAVEVLKEEFGKRRRVKDGTVIRFVMLDKYTYAAVYVAGKWYITGTGKWWGTNIFEHDDFVKAIGAATKMEVATEWEELE